MSSKTFKLSALAALVVSSTGANAALYRIVEVSSEGNETYASAIQQDRVTSDDLGCFASASCSSGDHQLAGDTRSSYEGFSYRQEVPFSIDNRFFYLDQDDIESYCENELGYSTCESWAFNQWFGSNGVGGLYSERQAWNIGTYTSNASAFLDSTTVDSPDAPFEPSSSTAIANSKNVVVNGMDGSTLIGNTSSGYFAIGSNAALMYRDRGYYGSALLLPKQESAGADSIVERMGRTMAFDSFEVSGTTYVVGSGSVAPFNYSDSDKDYLGDLDNCVGYSDPESNKECQNFAFAMKPYVWDVSSLDSDGNATGISASLWSGIGNSGGNDTSSTANEGDYSAQGSIRAAVVPNSGTSYDGKPVFVGYNTTEYNNRLLMQAAVFYPNATYDASGVVENAWDNEFVTNATVRIDGEYIYSNSVATDINDNLMLIGEAKRFGNKPEAGAANNRLFIADASSGSPSATYLSGGIFFTGAGGEANSINNFNEVVGQIDAEDNREINGKKRRRRAFIYPYNGTGTDSDRRDIFNNKAWWLDDLTNGGTYSSANNQFRVINASDINDDGVISATALKCSSGEYDSTAHNAYCGGGDADEEIVAVKLIPIANATKDDISERSGVTNTVTRKGAGLGFLTLTLLTLFSFRRRK